MLEDVLRLEAVERDGKPTKDDWKRSVSDHAYKQPSSFHTVGGGGLQRYSVIVSLRIYAHTMSQHQINLHSSTGTILVVV